MHVQKTLHLGWSNLPSPKTTSSWLSSLCGGADSHLPPFLSLPSLTEKTLTRRTKFHWPSFVDLPGMAAVRFKHRLFGLFCSREAADRCPPPPPPDTQEESLPSPPLLEQVQRQGSMTSLYQMEEVWGSDSTPGPGHAPPLCLWGGNVRS